jgi:hypothetical protein
MQKAAPQAPEVPACGAAFAVCGAPCGRFWTNDASCLVHKHSYLDLEYVYGALRMEQAGTGCVIAPDSTEGMSTLTKDKQSLEAMCRKGWQDAEKLVQWYRAAKAEA